ncbi:hypothetical protein [Fusobacterium sp. SYSU M8D902]|uniref:hypothetical protein n=1 Tax=Fusobacterium sp. SYSU M8D902 TaxID=3159562 RepID=UPI0032E4107D
MRAFNARKTYREHYLFKHKFRKLSLINKDGGIGVFKVRKLEDTNYKIFGNIFAMRYCFKEIKKILIGSRDGLSITEFIKRFEKAHNIKIKDIGLTRKDFSKNDIEKIFNALKINKVSKVREDK